MVNPSVLVSVCVSNVIFILFSFFSSDKYETTGEKLLQAYSVQRYSSENSHSRVKCFCETRQLKKLTPKYFPLLIFSSYISVIPPTPPPHLDHQFLSRLGVRHTHKFPV